MKNPTIGVLSRTMDEITKNKSGSLTEINKTLISFGACPVFFIYPTKEFYDKKDPEVKLETKEYVYKCLESVDGIVVPGGDVDFNKYDIEFIKKCIEKDIPILGICQGMQTMAIATGGSVRKHDDPATHYTKKNHAHSIEIEPKTYLHDIFEADTMEVNSRHNETVVDKGTYKVSARYKNKIEALEYPKNSFNVGVQWHPETMYIKEKEMSFLFADFIIAAEKYKNKK